MPLLFMEYVLETNALTKHYRGSIALDGLTMCIPQGTIYGFVGRNGAGENDADPPNLRPAGPDGRQLSPLRGQISPTPTLPAPAAEWARWSRRPRFTWA